MENDWVLFNRYYEDGSFASIIVNCGVAETIEQLPSVCIACSIDLKQPTEEGLLGADEIEGYQAFDEALLALLEEQGTTYVGRVVSGGRAITYLYGKLSSEVLSALGNQLTHNHGYECTWAIEEDKDYERYWFDLYPVKGEWRMIADEQLISQLEAAGDQLEVPRQIDHWVAFPDERSAQSFATWATEEGYQSGPVTGPNEQQDEWQVQITHTACPELADVGQTTVLFDEKAEELGGRYDGWETFLVGADA